MAKDISPEERLFNVIQRGKGSVYDNVSRAKKSGIGLKGLTQFFAGFFLKPRQGVTMPQYSAAYFALPLKLQDINLKSVNKALGIILFIFIILVIYSAANKGPDLARINFVISKDDSVAVKFRPIENFRSANFYTEDAKKRDIFHPVSVAVAAANPVNVNLQNMIKDLSLSGIYQGKNQEVIIEDKTSQKAYFLKQGDEIKGLKVKTIFKDRVILQYGGQEIELM